MSQFDTSQLLLLGLVAAPGIMFLGLAFGWLLGWVAGEKALARLTATTYLLAFAFAVSLGWRMWTGGQARVAVRLGDWFRVHSYEFPLELFVDFLSLPLITLTVTLAGLIGAFSRRYLHRDRGFHRFFALLHLFAFGAVLAFAAGSYDLIVAGWELVGITSVLLIAFFYERPDPVRSALRVFSIYRVCDLGLLWAVFLMHHSYGSASYDKVLAGGLAAPGIGLLLLLAAAGKSAQVPFSGWLPRAMEGPTPSSAIFYGAISVHLGAYLLLRSEPLLQATPMIAWAVIAVGIATALHGTMAGRACADAKTSLAYSSLAQLGLIFAEIGMGWSTLALIHMLGHGATRTLQFLRAPSMLHDFHQVHAAAGGHMKPAGTFFTGRLPESAQAWLFRLAMDRGHHDTLLDRFAVAPVLGLSRLLWKWEDSLIGAPPPESPGEGKTSRSAVGQAVAGGVDA